jgi:hypothetical protein
MYYSIRINFLEYWIKKVNYRRRIYHRKNNKPAIIRNGEKKYFLRGQLHREDDLPAVDYKNIKGYWVHGKQYEIITHSNGTKEWWFYSDNCSETNNKAILHRCYDKPAIEYANGDK